MSPLRWDVLLVGFVLAVPVLALGLRGDLSTEEMVTRLPWCLAAGWGVVALLRFASTPPRPAGAATQASARRRSPRTEPEPSPAGLTRALLAVLLALRGVCRLPDASRHPERSSTVRGRPRIRDATDGSRWTRTVLR